MIFYNRSPRTVVNRSEVSQKCTTLLYASIPYLPAVGRKRGHELTCACDGCKKDNCGKCKFCLDMPRFGGPGKKKRCESRKCTSKHYCTDLFLSQIHYLHSPTGIQHFEGKRSAKQFLEIHQRCIKKVLPDGNCFFRALGLQLGGFEELHQTLRELLVQFISCNQETFASWVTSGTMQSHLNNMQRNAKWATQVEIQAAASLFQVPIYVATNTIGTQGIYRWIVFQPHDKSSLIGPLENLHKLLPSFTIKPHLELCHYSNIHYDSIEPASREESLPPPPLDGGTKSSVDLTE